MDMNETPVFDRAHLPTPLIDAADDWAPARTRIRLRGQPVCIVDDGPAVERRLSLQRVWASSQRWDGRPVANDDWPLRKLLVTEKNDHCLSLAVRYRDIHDKASMPTELVGRDPENLYEVRNVDVDGKDKGIKRVAGRQADVSVEPKRSCAGSKATKQRAAQVAKAWRGDMPLINAIDARRELAIVRAKLGYVPAILDAFEMAVVDGLTLADIGKALGAGSKGAKGEARARIFDGFGILDRHW